MLITSTILYFGENPVGYDLMKEDNGYALQPTPNTKSNLIAPVISIVKSGEEWIIDGVQDADVIEQVRKIITTQGLINLPERLSAAS